MIVDGRVLVREQRFQLADEERLTAEGVAAVEKLWNMDEAQEYLARA